MFDFLQTIFVKVTSLAAVLLISVGLLSTPTPVAQPIVENTVFSTTTQEISAETRIKQEVELEESSSIKKLENQLAKVNKKIDELRNQLTINQKEAEISLEIEAEEVLSLTLEPTLISQQTVLIEKLEITSVIITPNIHSARIEWETNIPTESKVFISGSSLSPKLFSSESGLSTRHAVHFSDLDGDQIYLFEIEAISGETFTKKNGEFKTLTPPSPVFSIERVTLPNWPNNVFFRIKAENGNFIFEAITLKVNNPYDVHNWNNNQSNLDFIQRQTLGRSGWNYRTCETMNSVFQEYSHIDYPYPCPISNFPLYISWADKDWMGRSRAISLDPDLPFPQETEIYYYKVKEMNTNKIFEK